MQPSFDACFPTSASVGQSVVVSVRPESIVLSSQARSDNDQQINRLKGTVALSAFGGASNRYSIQAGEYMVTVASDAEIEREIGSNVILEFPSQKALAVAA